MNKAASTSDQELFENLLRNLRKDTLRYIPSAIVPAGLSIVGISVFTRLFDPLEYGRYAVVMAASTLTAALLSGWMEQSVLRYLPRFKAENRLTEFVMKLFVILKGLSLTVLLAAVIAYPLINESLDVYAPFFYPAVLLILGVVVFSSLNAAFQAELRSKESSLFKVFVSALRLGFALFFVFAIRKDVIGLVIGAAAANLLLVVPMIHRLGIYHNIRLFFKSYDSGFLKMFAAYGIPMVGWMLCGQILSISDRFIIGAFRGSSEVGIYSANYNLVTMGFGLISMPILTASYPLIMTTWEKGKTDKITGVIKEFSRYYLIAAIPVMMFIGVFSREIVSLVLGNRFREGFVIIPFILGGVGFWGLAMIGHKGLEIMEKTRVLLILVGISTGVNILLNFIFIPKYGYRGAAATTFISYMLYPLLVFLVTKPLIRWILPWRSIGKTLMAASVMGFAHAFLRHYIAAGISPLVTLVIAAVTGLPLYVAVLLILKEIKLLELKRLAGFN